MIGTKNTAYDFSDIKAKTEAIYQEIISSTQKNLYLIYQPESDDNFMNRYEGIKQEKLPYLYFKIPFGPRIVPLKITEEKSQKLLKESIAHYLSAITPTQLLQNRPRLIYGWTQSDWDIEKLSLRLARISIQEIHNQKILLRFLDPSVWSALIHILTKRQQNKICHILEPWWQIDGDGALQQFRIIGDSYYQSDNLYLTDEQKKMIDNIGICNQILRHYRQRYIQEMRWSEHQLYPFLLEVLQTAPLDYDKSDKVYYGYLCLTVHPQFMRHPLIMETIAKSGYRRLTKQLSTLTDEQWQTIKEELIAEEIHNG